MLIKAAMIMKIIKNMIDSIYFVIDRSEIEIEKIEILSIRVANVTTVMLLLPLTQMR